MKYQPGDRVEFKSFPDNKKGEIIEIRNDKYGERYLIDGDNRMGYSRKEDEVIRLIRKKK